MAESETPYQIFYRGLMDTFLGEFNFKELGPIIELIFSRNKDIVLIRVSNQEIEACIDPYFFGCETAKKANRLLFGG